MLILGLDPENVVEDGLVAVLLKLLLLLVFLRGVLMGDCVAERVVPALLLLLSLLFGLCGFC